MVMMMDDLANFLLDKGAAEVGYAHIGDVTPKNGLDYGIVFYMIYLVRLSKQSVTLQAGSTWNIMII